MVDSAPVKLSPADIVELNPTFLYRWEEAQQSHVLLYPEGLVKLNDTAAAILGQCLTARPIAEVIAALCAAFGTSDIDGDVIEFLETSFDKGWVRVKA